jgi:type I restriction-modification system DNA methylase subunit
LKLWTGPIRANPSGRRSRPSRSDRADGDLEPHHTVNIGILPRGASGREKHPEASQDHLRRPLLDPVQSLDLEGGDALHDDPEPGPDAVGAGNPFGHGVEKIPRVYHGSGEGAERPRRTTLSTITSLFRYGQSVFVSVESSGTSPSSKDEAHSALARLVEKYRSEEAQGRLPDYNEANVRLRFINPLLRALGWDIESPDEVSVEDHLLSGYSDYALKIPGERRPRVFVEAKRFELGATGLDGYTERGGRKISFPQQAVQYAWQTQAAWSVLTNFKETRLYSSYIDPEHPDDGCVFKIRLEDYEARFEELWAISKDSVASGALDEIPRKKARETIQVEAPAALFECRSDLAQNIHILNPDISITHVQEAAQRILDRLIVMRAAEDRQVLPSESLWKLYSTWKDTQIDPSALFVASLRHQFEQFDRIYDSEMFAPGHICDRVAISNAAAQSVLETLYEYNFNLIDADILGSIYEGYLGFVLKEERGELRFRREDQERKKHGVYYTPTFVVEYIVDRTLGRALEGASTERAASVRVVDPACGSGSFLIKAFDRFAEFYSRANLAARLSAKGRRTVEEHEGRPEEVHNFRERILRDNLFGVDLDGQAAEIASINLMLKALRKGQKLPLILRENIRVGNSLISGSEAELKPYFGDTWVEKKPFDWVDQFPFLKEGGFDVIIGNPPYVDSKAIPEPEREYFHDATKRRELPFPAAYKKTDLYVLFIELGLRLLKPGGRLSFIIPDRFLYSPYGTKLREVILNTCVIEEIIDLTNVRVFPHQSVWNVILVLRKEEDTEARDRNQVRIGVVPAGYPVVDGIPEPSLAMPQSDFRAVPGFQFRLQLRDPRLRMIVRKMEEAGTRLNDIYYVNWGLRTGTDEKTERLITSDGHHPLARRLIRGENIIDRYLLEWTGQYIIYDSGQLVNPLFPEVLESPKIVIRKISGDRGLFASYDSEGLYPFSTVILALPFSALEGVERARVPAGAGERSKSFLPLFVLAVVNSKAAKFYFDAMVTDGLSVAPDQVRQIPIPPARPDLQESLGVRVTNLLRLRKELQIETRLGAFRHVISTRTRVGDDDFGHYMNRLGESGLGIGSRLDGVNKASQVSISPELRDDHLVLHVQFVSGKPPGERSGEIVCRFDHVTSRFLGLVLIDREKNVGGKGRLMTKIRAVEVPRFDPDWERHLGIVEEIVATVERHERRAAEIAVEMRAEEREIDRTVYGLYGLDDTEIGLIESQGSPLSEASQVGENKT